MCSLQSYFTGNSRTPLSFGVLTLSNAGIFFIYIYSLLRSRIDDVPDHFGKIKEHVNSRICPSSFPCRQPEKKNRLDSFGECRRRRSSRWRRQSRAPPPLNPRSSPAPVPSLQPLHLTSSPRVGPSAAASPSQLVPGIAPMASPVSGSSSAQS
jgi:hypothetical protein